MRIKKFISKKSLVILVAFLVIFTVGLGVGLQSKPTNQIQDQYLGFVAEVYDKIKENYWEEIGEKELTETFRQSLEAVTGFPQILKNNSKNDLLELLKTQLTKLDNDKKKELVAKLSDTVLASLKPAGRSRLYTQKDESSLKNRVNNVNPDNNLYQILGVSEKASGEEIKKTSEEKVERLQEEVKTDPQKSEELKRVISAKEVLTDKDNKQLYDQTGAEPTVFAKLLSPDVVYLKIAQVSPVTFEEFQRALAKIDPKASPTSLILDLRDNVGGSIDILPYFLGPFIGQNQYAYDFFHQGVSSPFKTQTGWLPALVKFKKNVILINSNTQSTAEVMAAVLKKYNIGVLVGTKTKGWGTVEKVYPLSTQLDPSEKYSIFLVHSLTLREDNQPIEGRGVDPAIDITQPGWDKELFSHFNSTELINAVKDLVENKNS